MNKNQKLVQRHFQTELLQAGRKMLHSGLTVETWGNLSLRDPAAGLIYVTPSAMPYDTLTEDDVVVMDESGAVVSGSRKPTVESEMHLAVYRSRPEINAVIHTHPVYSMVFAVLRRPIPPIIDEAAQALGGAVPVTEYALPGTHQLAKNVQKALGKDGMACLLANHGAVCLGTEMEQAFRTCTVLEMTARVYQMALQIGRPCPISAADVAYMRDFLLHHYGQNK
ncbi:MAG: class II aldolase/adducin family protein [Oscillospiraceae bacterium]|jgi:L-fuculose-phosphate aldolase|nr:class II aldolase/adducin family protein [Oscillospiraceae bacterium]MDD3261969.1 class II aldolase/adducin family protein [Oscillospiraceae bacterium]